MRLPLKHRYSFSAVRFYFETIHRKSSYCILADLTAEAHLLFVAKKQKLQVCVLISILDSDSISSYFISYASNIVTVSCVFVFKLQRTMWNIFLQTTWLSRHKVSIYISILSFDKEITFLKKSLWNHFFKEIILKIYKIWIICFMFSTFCEAFYK